MAGSSSATARRTTQQDPRKTCWSARIGSARSTEAEAMKVQPSVKKICDKCKVIRRHGRVMVICENLRHKQRQG